MEMTVEKAVELATANLHGNIYINAGIDRRVSTKRWEKGDAIRTYISIYCYTLNGRYKGAYKCGYVDEVSGKYVVTRYDDIDLTTGEKPELK